MNPFPPSGRAAAVSADARTHDLPVGLRVTVADVRFNDAQWLFALGCVSGLAYAVVAVFFWTDEIFTRGFRTIAVKMIGIGIPSILYLYGIRFVKRTPLRVILGFAILFAVVGALTLPFDSTDVFFYIAAGWHQFHYDENPYSSLMRDVPGLASDRMITNSWMAMNKNPWRDSPFPYGFGFALLTRIVAGLGGGNWWATLAIFSVLNLLVHVSMSALLWRTAGLIPGVDPRLVFYLYTWNPMVLMQSLANDHNDILMAFGILAAAYFVLRGDAKWSIPLLVLAGLIKYGAFVLLPFAGLVTLRSQGVKALLKASAFGGLLGILALAPYRPKNGSFKLQLLLLQATESGGSLHAFAATLFRLGGRIFSPLNPMVQSVAAALEIVLALGFLGFLLHKFIQAARVQLSAVSMIQMWTTVLFVAICIVSPQFYSWYLVILLPIALLNVGALLGRAVLILTTTHVLAFADLRRKSIGYFAICTLLPLAVLYWRDRRVHPSGVKEKGAVQGQTAPS